MGAYKTPARGFGVRSKKTKRARPGETAQPTRAAQPAAFFIKGLAFGGPKMFN